jgi:hypothetical protein
MDAPDLRREAAMQQEIERLRAEVDNYASTLKAVEERVRDLMAKLCHEEDSHTETIRIMRRARDSREMWVLRADRYRTFLARALSAAQDPQWLQCRWRTRETAGGVWSRTALPSRSKETKR